MSVFLLGSVAVAGLVPYTKLGLQTGVFTALQTVLVGQWHAGWLVQILAVLICYGSLSGALAWLSSPSRGLLATARDGVLPPILQKTNKQGMQRNILILQALIVTAVSSIYLVTSNVSGAFFLISTITISLYIVMYMLMYAAAIKLRYSQPTLERAFRIPGGNMGMWVVAGAGFLAVTFALVVSFAPPSQLPVGSPTLYVALVSSGLVVFVAAALLIYRYCKPSWANGSDSEAKAPLPQPRPPLPAEKSPLQPGVRT